MVSDKAIKSKMRLAKIVKYRRFKALLMKEQGFTRKEIMLETGYKAFSSLFCALDAIKEEMSYNHSLKIEYERYKNNLIENQHFTQ